jgi:hypothetical protein
MSVDRWKLVEEMSENNKTQRETTKKEDNKKQSWSAR